MTSAGTSANADDLLDGGLPMILLPPAPGPAQSRTWRSLRSPSYWRSILMSPMVRGARYRRLLPTSWVEGTECRQMLGVWLRLVGGAGLPLLARDRPAPPRRLKMPGDIACAYTLLSPHFP